MSNYYEAEHDPHRETSMACLPDSMVDVCLYLIEPHQLPQVDTDAITALGRFVPIVPLLANW